MVSKDPETGGEKVSQNSLLTFIKKWNELHPEGLGKKVQGWGNHVMLTEEEAVRLLWFIHKGMITSQLRIRARITKADTYKGPVYTQLPEPERREADILIDESIKELVKNDDMVGLYLKEVAETDLLTAEEEVELAKRIQKGRKAQEILNLRGELLSTSLSERHRLLVEDGEKARQHMIKANTRLVISVARKYIGILVEFPDLIQEGNLGLIKAVEKFDWRRGFKFSTYATWWIRQTITRALADKGRTIRVPVHLHDEIGYMLKVVKKFQQERSRLPTPEEIAEIMGHKLPKVKLMLRAATVPLSIEAPVSEEKDSVLGDFIEDEDALDPFESVSEIMMRDKLEEVLATLEPREARIIRLRFGLYEGPSLTLEEVGAMFGVTKKRIRQLETKALRHLRHPHRSRTLRDYHEM